MDVRQASPASSPAPARLPSHAATAKSPPAPSLAGDRLATAPAILPLGGRLDDVPMLNANHPEMVRGPGISVSTLPFGGPGHLAKALRGSFEVFVHHNNQSGRDLYQTVVLHNPGSEPVTVKVGPSASYTSETARYRDRGPMAGLDPTGRFVSGPGDATASALLRGERAVATERLVLAPGEFKVLHTQRFGHGKEITSQYRLATEGPVHAAVLIERGGATAATAEATLRQGQLLARNRADKAPTPPGGKGGELIYGRASGVQEGARYEAILRTDASDQTFTLPNGRFERSYVINGQRGNSLGTGDVQVADLSLRYPDAAYQAHGNYGVEYRIRVPLANRGESPREVALYFDSPGKPDRLSRAFRGTVAVDLTDAKGQVTTRYMHVSQKRGERGDTPLATVTVPPGEIRSVQVRLVYPANATPPHALRVQG